MAVMKHGERKSAREMKTTASLHLYSRSEGSEWAQENWAEAMVQKRRSECVIVGTRVEGAQEGCLAVSVPLAGMYS